MDAIPGTQAMPHRFSHHRTVMSRIRPFANAHAIQQGFSLVEVLVVLVIIGIATATIGLSLSPDPSRALRQEARQLAQLLSIAQTEVRIDGRLIAWSADDSGYQFSRGVWRQAPGSVVPMVDTTGELDDFARDDALRRRNWRTPDTKVHPSGPLILTSEWIGHPLELTLDDGNARVMIRRDAAGAFHVQ